MWSICGTAVTSSSFHYSVAPLTLLVMPHRCMINIRAFSSTLCPVCTYVCVCVWERTKRDEKAEIYCGSKWSWCLLRGVEGFTHHIPLIALSMWGHRGCCAHCEWPQRKASQLGRNAGMGGPLQVQLQAGAGCCFVSWWNKNRDSCV